MAIPAAQYLRMSTEDQQYSMTNQSLRIKEYADTNGFDIVKTYEDPGKSGVIIKHRHGLRALLKEVVNGTAGFKAILVYDVSRWGRFQNPDEAAHYEFLCAESGIPLHYCAEQFSNDGTASSAIVKALKRSMAAEFSRELGEKVVRGKTQLAKMGFWMGGPPGYGYRRRLVSSDGKLKRVLKDGEQKSLKTERIALVLGPRKEIRDVRMIFSMAAHGRNCTEIVRELSAKKILFKSRSWNDVTILDILTNPKYTGCGVWNRRTQRLHTTRRQLDPPLWITKPFAFPAIVDQQTFDRAQAAIQKMRDSRWPDEKILKRIRRLLQTTGRLSEGVLLRARGMPCLATIHKHFGTFRQLYERLGYDLDARYVFRSDQLQRSKNLRRSLVGELKRLFPSHVSVALSRNGARAILRIDDAFMVSIVFCRPQRTQKGRCWAAKPNPAEADYITLLCFLNHRHDRVLRYYVAPRLVSRNEQRLYRRRRCHFAAPGKPGRIVTRAAKLTGVSRPIGVTYCGFGLGFTRHWQNLTSRGTVVLIYDCRMKADGAYRPAKAWNYHRRMALAILARSFSDLSIGFVPSHSRDVIVEGHSLEGVVHGDGKMLPPCPSRLSSQFCERVDVRKSGRDSRLIDRRERIVRAIPQF